MFLADGNTFSFTQDFRKSCEIRNFLEVVSATNCLQNTVTSPQNALKTLSYLPGLRLPVYSLAL